MAPVAPSLRTPRPAIVWPPHKYSKNTSFAPLLPLWRHDVILAKGVWPGHLRVELPSRRLLTRGDVGLKNRPPTRGRYRGVRR